MEDKKISNIQTSMKISAVILSKNEEKNIKDCIASLAFCNEIIVIDDYSNDLTTQIAHKLGAKVITRSLGGDFAVQRNYGLKKARYEWVLFIDCDERVPENLKKEIARKMKMGKYDAFTFKRDDYLLGRKMLYGETSRVRLLRMAKKGTGNIGHSAHFWGAIFGVVFTIGIKPDFFTLFWQQLFGSI